jgi:acetolactate synthase I/II/III large subunit
MGVHAIRVSSASELPEKMKEFLDYDRDRPVLLDCVIESHQHLYPLVCPGSTINLRRSSLILVCYAGSARQGTA